MRKGLELRGIHFSSQSFRSFRKKRKCENAHNNGTFRTRKKKKKIIQVKPCEIKQSLFEESASMTMEMLHVKNNEMAERSDAHECQRMV